ncbi:MAG: alpha/beta hydrolase [Candidatus Eremiobacteraeota bacterium]|nr:alpha/beta hydrolase [Candidatus Eremiobacteraeota bacterium]
MLRTLLIVAGLGLVPKIAVPLPAPVQFSAADGVEIYANVYRTSAPSAPAILLFHQAGSSKSEYASIAPRLAQLGYNVLAIDQRSGGELYQPPNETVRHAGKSAPYTSVLVDMDAALDFAKRRFPGALLVAWGSSYSAGLVFPFAARHAGDVAAVVAFSPGEYFADKHFVTDAARRVTVPVFIDSAADAAEEKSARAIFNAVASHRKKQYVPQHGIHGSSTLRDDRDPDGAAENWDAVTAFLGTLVPTR